MLVDGAPGVGLRLLSFVHPCSSPRSRLVSVVVRANSVRGLGLMSGLPGAPFGHEAGRVTHPALGELDR